MDKRAVKEVMYGGIQEMCRNRQLYYKGISPEYSHWTEEGKKALQSFMDMMSYQVIKAEEEDLKDRSKEMIIKGLKGENQGS